MNVIKHGKVYNELHKKYNLTCQYCGCEFEAERCELSQPPIGTILTEYQIDRYKNEGKEALIACPECRNIVKCKVSITEEERESLEKYRRFVRWKKHD